MGKVLVFVFGQALEDLAAAIVNGSAGGQRPPFGLFNRPDLHVLCIGDAVSAPTAPRLRSYLIKHAIDNVTVLQSPLPLGHGGLQKLGYRFAIDRGFDFIVLLPGSRVAKPELVLPLCAEWQRSGADVVLGVRATATTAAEPAYRRFKSRLMARLQNLATGKQLADYHASLRGYSTAFLRKVPFEANTNEPHFDTELLLQACYVGARITEVALPAAADPSESYRIPAPRSTREALRSTLQFKMHQMGMLCSIKYRDLQPEKYRDKTEMIYSSHAQVLELVAQRAPQRLLDLGSGTGHVARRCRELGASVTGVDVRPPQPGTMDAYHRCDLDSEAIPIDPFAFDMVLLLDVIEHLSNPEEFLTRLRNQSESIRLVESAPQFIVSTPNVAFAAVRLNLLLGRFNYAERGILDITHKRLFTRASLLTALRDCGYKVERVLPVGVPFEAVMGGQTARLLGRLCHQLAVLWPTLFAFQFIVVCTPLPGIGQLLRLAANDKG